MACRAGGRGKSRFRAGTAPCVLFCTPYYIRSARCRQPALPVFSFSRSKPRLWDSGTGAPPVNYNGFPTGWTPDVTLRGEKKRLLLPWPFAIIWSACVAPGRLTHGLQWVVFLLRHTAAMKSARIDPTPWANPWRRRRKRLCRTAQSPASEPRVRARLRIHYNNACSKTAADGCARFRPSGAAQAIGRPA